MKRPKIPSMLSKQVYQEAASCCVFCNESDVAALEIHHLDDDPTRNVLENLLLVCSTCHSKITHGGISPADAQLQKRTIQFQGKKSPGSRSEPRQSVTVSSTQNTGIIANVVNIKGRKPPKLRYPSDSIGADTIKNGYIHYLYGKYIDYRKADTSFGAFAHASRFHPGELHRTIRSKFKAQTFFLHVARFNELVQYMQGRIDQTILGKRNRSRGVPNCGSFEDYQREQLGNAK
jgi:hypothetical protein